MAHTRTYNLAHEITELTQQYQVTRSTDTLTEIYHKVRSLSMTILRSRTTSVTVPFRDVEYYAEEYATYFITRLYEDKSFMIETNAYTYIVENIKYIVYKDQRVKVHEELPSHVDSASCIKTILQSYHQELNYKNPESSVVWKLHISAIMEMITEMLGPNRIPLFVEWILGCIEDLSLVVREDQALIRKYKVCRSVLVHRLKSPDYNTLINTVTSQSSIQSFLIMYNLSRIDSTLPYIPMIIGEENFIRLLRFMDGSSLKFPSQQELAELYNKTAPTSASQGEELTTEAAAVISDLIRFNPQIPDIDYSECTTPYDHSSDDLIVSYFMEIYQKIDKAINLIITQLERVSDSAEEPSVQELVKHLPQLTEFIRSQSMLFSELREFKHDEKRSLY